MNILRTTALSLAILAALAILFRVENQHISSQLLPKVFDSKIASLLKERKCDHWELLSHQYSDVDNSHYYLTTIGKDKVEIVIYLSMMGWEIHTMINDGQ